MLPELVQDRNEVAGVVFVGDAPDSSSHMRCANGVKTARFLAKVSMRVQTNRALFSYPSLADGVPVNNATNVAGRCYHNGKKESREKEILPFIKVQTSTPIKSLSTIWSSEIDYVQAFVLPLAKYLHILIGK